MKTEWQALPTFQDVAKAQANGWEIEVKSAREWVRWNGTSWLSLTMFRGRPAQPKATTVTSLCWRNKWDGNLCWYSHGNTPSSDWQRFHCGDISGEVEE